MQHVNGHQAAFLDKFNGLKQRIYKELNLIFFQGDSIGFELCYIRLQIAIIGVFGN